MTIIFDDNEVILRGVPHNVESLCEMLRIKPEDGYAISVNGSIVSILEYDTIELRVTDKIEIIIATQGG